MRDIFILGVLGFLKTTRSFPKIPEEVWSLPKTSKVPVLGCVRINASSLPVLFTSKSEIARKVLSFIHFTHAFRSLHLCELTYFWNCVKQNGNNSHFSIRREKLACRREINIFGLWEPPRENINIFWNCTLLLMCCSNKYKADHLIGCGKKMKNYAEILWQKWQLCG